MHDPARMLANTELRPCHYTPRTNKSSFTLAAHSLYCILRNPRHRCRRPGKRIDFAPNWTVDQYRKRLYEVGAYTLNQSLTLPPFSALVISNYLFLPFSNSNYGVFGVLQVPQRVWNEHCCQAIMRIFWRQNNSNFIIGIKLPFNVIMIDVFILKKKQKKTFL